MKNWRPPNWDETKQIGDDVLNNEDYLDKVYEAGADAMLEVLRERGFELADGEGHSVIIPPDDD